jgi:G3E family GTPase
MTFTFAAVGGFLGAGKTTTLTALARALEARGRRTALITNDPGEGLVDTAVARAASPAAHVAEVTGGCFCCRFDDLLDVVGRAVEEHGAEVVLAEAVGSCTDLQATVVRPLRQEYGARVRVAPLVTVVDPARFLRLAAEADPDLAYLFDRQLADADLIALNKCDAVPVGTAAAVRTALGSLHPEVPVHRYAARTGAGLDALVEALVGRTEPALPGRAADLDLDYDRYAAAEARLAWLNHTVTITGTPRFAPAAWGLAFLAALADHGWFVGHAKVHLTGDGGCATRVHLAGGAPEAAEAGEPVREATARINARVACGPGRLDAAVRDAVRTADAAAGAVTSAPAEPTSFRPAYPRPVHRVPVGT